MFLVVFVGFCCCFFLGFGMCSVGFVAFGVLLFVCDLGFVF